MKRLVLAAVLAVGLVIAPFAGGAGAAPASGSGGVVPYDANPQQHCNQLVCVGAQSYDGDGNYILQAEVETAGLFTVPAYTVFYLNYGPNPAAAKTRIPRYCIVENPAVGCSFSIVAYLNVGWVLCGQIVGYPGYPCITIGAEDDSI